MRYSL